VAGAVVGLTVGAGDGDVGRGVGACVGAVVDGRGVKGLGVLGWGVGARARVPVRDTLLVQLPLGVGRRLFVQETATVCVPVSLNVAE